ncbi:MAG: META domain-containing protein [Myxococcota bacterium]
MTRTLLILLIGLASLSCQDEGGPDPGDSRGDTRRPASLEAIAATPWVLTHFAEGDPAPAQPAITLQLGEGRLSGSSGCNRYTAAVESGAEVGSLLVGPIAGTRMACPAPIDALERRYLEALEGVKRFERDADRLTLHWEREGDSGSLVYAPGASQPGAPH